MTKISDFNPNFVKLLKRMVFSPEMETISGNKHPWIVRIIRKEPKVIKTFEKFKTYSLYDKIINDIPISDTKEKIILEFGNDCANFVDDLQLDETYLISDERLKFLKDWEYSHDNFMKSIYDLREKNEDSFKIMFENFVLKSNKQPLKEIPKVTTSIDDALFNELSRFLHTYELLRRYFAIIVKYNITNVETDIRANELYSRLLKKSQGRYDHLFNSLKGDYKLIRNSKGHAGFSIDKLKGKIICDDDYEIDYKNDELLKMIYSLEQIWWLTEGFILKRADTIHELEVFSGF